jgi:hypothetical protein
MNRFKRWTMSVIAVIAWGIALGGAPSAKQELSSHAAELASSPWTRVVYDDDGTVLKATGHGERRVPIGLSVSRERLDNRPGTTTTYVRGKETLRIERIYDPGRSLNVSFRTDLEQWSLSVLRDAVTGEALALYTLTDGVAYSLWVDEGGHVLSGDVESLRQALTAPSAIGRLLRHYVRDREPLRGHLPTSGEESWRVLPLVDCKDVCALGCPRQCAWECAIGVCDICMISCAIGCAIGC